VKINEIFYSLQGEGYHSGMPAAFIRFSGCNLHCPFCDTQHESGVEMTEEEIVTEVKRYPAQLVVVTGGEPALQLTESLVDALHGIGKTVAVETNGTLALPDNVDWITLSPKDTWLGDEAVPVLGKADELKVVFDGEQAPSAYSNIAEIAMEKRITVSMRLIRSSCTVPSASSSISAPPSRKLYGKRLKRPAARLSMAVFLPYPIKLSTA
jgi:organic radical activating enzyme